MRGTFSYQRRTPVPDLTLVKRPLRPWSHALDMPDQHSPALRGVALYSQVRRGKSGINSFRCRVDVQSFIESKMH